jgi:DNA-binding LacI/PurR family transcriptional regulator
MQMLLALMDGRPATNVVLAPTLAVRASTARPAGGF